MLRFRLVKVYVEPVEALKVLDFVEVRQPGNYWSDHTFLSERSQVGLSRAIIVSGQKSKKGVLTKIEVCHTLVC